MDGSFCLGHCYSQQKHKVVYPSKVALLILLVKPFLLSCPHTFHTKIIQICNWTFRAGRRVGIAGHMAEAPHTELTQLPTYLKIQTVPTAARGHRPLCWALSVRCLFLVAHGLPKPLFQLDWPWPSAPCKLWRRRCSSLSPWRYSLALAKSWLTSQPPLQPASWSPNWLWLEILVFSPSLLQLLVEVVPQCPACQTLSSFLPVTSSKIPLSSSSSPLYYLFLDQTNPPLCSWQPSSSGIYLVYLYVHI